MKTFIQTTVMAFLLLTSIQYVKAQCHIDDWNALKDLYNATDGDNWFNNTNWDILSLKKQPFNCNLASLFGIQINLNGRVSEVNLYNNNLSGILPGSIGNITGLERLFLGYDAISGNIPPEIGNLNNLYVLSLSDTQLMGTIPATFGNLNNLEILYLYNNNLSGDIPAVLGNLSQLKFLYIQNNMLNGNLPPSFANLINLSRLYISDNQLDGCYPASWNILCNQLTFGFISEGNNFDASWIDFCANNDGVCIPDPLFCNTQDWQALKALYNATNGNNWSFQTNWNIVTTPTPAANCNLNELYGISLDNNGRISDIELFANNLTGYLPPEIGQLSELENLYLDYNQIAGVIPSEVGNLSQLKTLSLQNNQHTGSIPPEIGNLDSLCNLQLNNNQLSGSIPEELGNLSMVETLFLFSNQLSGRIPASFAQLNMLTSLHVGNNQLTGCYDEALLLLCDQLQFSEISNGNFFEATWADFCQAESGICTDNNFSTVWPGDVNFDGIVNSIDIMHLGNYLNQSNQNILNDGMNWQNYQRPNWGINQHADFCLYGYDDLKHADCDGNGIIDSLDLEVIIQNWNQTHQDAPFIQPINPCFHFDDFSDYSLSLQPVGDINSNPLICNIVLSNSVTPVKIRSGFLRINYFNPTEPNLLGADMVLTDSWLGEPNINLWYHEVFNAPEKSIEAGFTKTDLINGIGEGVIGQVAFFFDDFDATTVNNIANFYVEFGFQNSDTTSVFLQKIFKVNLGESICEDILLVTEQLPFNSEYVGNETLLTNGEVSIFAEQQVAYKAGNRITMNEGFSVKAGADFKVRFSGCN